MPAIFASLRSANLDDLEHELARLQQSGVSGLHLDIMDGVFCDEVCFPLELVERIRALTPLLLDAHLMVDEPERVIADWIKAGVNRISFHLEACTNPGPALDQIRAAGLKAGLVILPGTAIEELDPWLDQVDLINPLGVNPVAGTGYDERTPARIAALHQNRAQNGHRFLIQADGGVWEKTRAALTEAGADELVGGFPIFSKNDYKQAVRELARGI